MSTAYTIRDAVTDMRIDASAVSDPDHHFLHAVADWLEHVADRLDHRDLCREMGVPVSPGEARRSLAVARAYLGEQP